MLGLLFFSGKWKVFSMYVTKYLAESINMSLVCKCLSVFVRKYLLSFKIWQKRLVYCVQIKIACMKVVPPNEVLCHLAIKTCFKIVLQQSLKHVVADATFIPSFSSPKTGERNLISVPIAKILLDVLIGNLLSRNVSII